MSRALTPLAAAVLLLGIADSMVGSYLVLFAADEVGLSPLQIGVFASAPAVGGMVISSLLGRRFDRHPTRMYTVVVTAAGALGLVLYAETRSFGLLVLVAATLVGAVAAAFPQLFALARVVLGAGPAGRRSAPLLRSAWSLAWATGPLLGAALLTRTGFPTLMLAAAAILATTAVVTVTIRPGRFPHPLRTVTRLRNPSRPLPPCTSSWPRRASRCSSPRCTRAPSALPLYVTRALARPSSTVGVLFSACAVVEVLAALGLAALPARTSQRLLILGGMITFVLYFVLTVIADGVGLLLLGQAARGIAIAVVGSAGIRYFQDLLAPATGRATTLFSNASTAGSLIAGVLAGAAIGLVGYTTTLDLCGAVAAAAAGAFWASATVGRHQQSRQVRASLLHGRTRSA